MSSGVAALRSVAAGRRALTLRARVYKLRVFFTWLFKERGQRFPRVVEHILDYLTFVSDSRCTRSSLISTKASLCFLEFVAGVPLQEQLTKSPLFVNLYKELLCTKGARVLPRQAPRPFLVLLAAMETYLLDSSRPIFLRVHCWWKLVECWGVLRHADHRGFIPRDPSLFIVRDGSLRATLVRSKTTGPDKLVKSRPVFISLVLGLCITLGSLSDGRPC